MKMKKALVLLLAAVLLVACSVMGTLAYLTSTTEVAQNTFTVGDVAIKLDEAKVNGVGEPINTKSEVVTELANAERVLANSYKLLPGQTYTKDPTVYVEKNSVESYIRMQVTVSSIEKLQAAFGDSYMVDGVFLLQKLVDWNATNWEFGGYANGVYTFYYVNGKSQTYTATTGDDGEYDTLPALFTEIVIPGTIDNNALKKLQDVKIDVVAHAIQVAGFENNRAGAWAAFETQKNQNNG